MSGSAESMQTEPPAEKAAGPQGGGIPRQCSMHGTAFTWGPPPHWPMETLSKSLLPQPLIINNEKTPRPRISKYLGVEFSELPNDLVVEGSAQLSEIR